MTYPNPEADEIIRQFLRDSYRDTRDKVDEYTSVVSLQLSHRSSITGTICLFCALMGYQEGYFDFNHPLPIDQPCVTELIDSVFVRFGRLKQYACQRLFGEEGTLDELEAHVTAYVRKRKLTALIDG